MAPDPRQKRWFVISPGAGCIQNMQGSESYEVAVAEATLLSPQYPQIHICETVALVERALPAVTMTRIDKGC